MCFTWRVKMHSDLSLRSCVTGYFLPLRKGKGLGFRFLAFGTVGVGGGGYERMCIYMVC